MMSGKKESSSQHNQHSFATEAAEHIATHVAAEASGGKPLSFSTALLHFSMMGDSEKEMNERFAREFHQHHSKQEWERQQAANKGNQDKGSGKAEYSCRPSH